MSICSDMVPNVGMGIIQVARFQFPGAQRGVSQQETEKPRMAMEIRALWKAADEANGKGGNAATGGAKQRMTIEELTKHLKSKSIKSIKEWIETKATSNSSDRQKEKTGEEREDKSKSRKSGGGKSQTGRSGKAKESQEKQTNHGLAQETGRGRRKTGR